MFAVALVPAAIFTYQEWRSARDRADTVERIRSLEERVNETDPQRRAELRAKYPLGYIRFGVDENNIVIPAREHNFPLFEMDWDQTTIEREVNRIDVNIHGLWLPSRKVGLSNVGLSLFLEVGAKTGFDLAGLVIVLEILEVEPDPICVLGLARPEDVAATPSR